MSIVTKFKDGATGETKEVKIPVVINGKKVISKYLITTIRDSNGLPLSTKARIVYDNFLYGRAA